MEMGFNLGLSVAAQYSTTEQCRCSSLHRRQYSCLLHVGKSNYVSTYKQVKNAQASQNANCVGSLRHRKTIHRLHVGNCVL